MMSNSSLIALLHLICRDQIQYAKTRQFEIIGYVEVFRRPYDNAIIGITEQGDWCLTHRNTAYPIRCPADADVFLLLLCSPLQEVIALIKYGLDKLGLSEEVGVTFPFDDIIIQALTGKWRQKALLWIAEGYPMNDNMREIVYGKNRQAWQWLEYERARKGPMLNL